MRMLLLVLVLTACSPSPTEPPVVCSVMAAPEEAEEINCDRIQP